MRSVHHPWLNGRGGVYKFLDQLLFRLRSCHWVMSQKCRPDYELREELVSDQEAAMVMAVGDGSH